MRLLLLDTCGETGLVALSDGERIVEETALHARDASRTLLDAIGGILAKAGWKMGNLDAVAVVAGPGSFTGVRVGMAAAKGLCEATGLRLVPLSRLAVLANAEGGNVCAVLDAGRGEFYVRAADGKEVLASRDELIAICEKSKITVCEQKVFDTLSGLAVQNQSLTLASALPLAFAELKRQPQDAALADANYVRREQDIYAKSRA